MICIYHKINRMKERKKEKNIGKNIRLSKIKKVKEKSAVIEK